MLRHTFTLYFLLFPLLIAYMYGVTSKTSINYGNKSYYEPLEILRFQLHNFVCVQIQIKQQNAVPVYLRYVFVLAPKFKKISALLHIQV